MSGLDEAIAFARNRVLIAQAFVDETARRERAGEAVQILAEFKEAGKALDEAFHTIAEQGGKLNDLLSRLHAASGSHTPSYEQLDVLGFHAMQTALAATPWARRYRPQQPYQRQHFGSLFNGWATSIENRLRPLLTETDEAA